MLRFLQRKKPWGARAAPEGLRLYAVGDVHGRLDALDALVGAIRRDARTAAHAVLVMLGDYVDRGPASRQVIERLVELGRDPHLQTRFVRGNHDDTMLNFLADPAVGPSWCGFGGVETLRSYGVTAPPERDDAQGWADVSAAFRAAIPDAHVRFLQALEPWVEYGDYFFTHAGVRPGVALAEQDPNDLMWIRETFLRSSAVFSKTIVHGHTPEPDAFISDRRIGVDTGAFATGRLTAVALEGAGRRLIQVRVRGADIFVEHIGVARQGVRTKARGQARA